MATARDTRRWLLAGWLIAAPQMAPAAAEAEGPAAEAGAEGSEADPSRLEARELDQRGRDEFSRGQYVAAARSFARAHELLPHPATKYNEALSWEKHGDLARAATAYEAALAMGSLDADRTAASNERLEGLRRIVGRLRIREPVGGRVRVAFHGEVPIPASLYVDPGMVSVELWSPAGARSERVVEVDPGETVVVELAPRPDGPRPSPPASEPTPVVGIVLLGIAGAAGVASVVLGVQTLDARDEFEASGRLDEDARDDAVALRAATNITAGGAIVAGAIGLWLVLSGGGDPDPPAVSSSFSIWTGGDAGGVSLTF